MTRKELDTAVEAAKDTIKAVIETIYGTLNTGQKKKLLKDEVVKALFDQYNVEYDN